LFTHDIGRFKIVEWLKERHSEHWTAALDMKQIDVITGRPDKNV
jgi:hypothetical protein